MPTEWTITDKTRALIDALFADCTNTTPGAAMAIYRDDEVVYANGYGIANLEHMVPITPGTVFDIASVSKQFTAMCIALLQQDGLLNVDDPIQQYLPELPEWEHPVTVRHLLHHTSGIRDYLGILPLSGWREEDQMTNADCLNCVRRQKTLEFEPNTKHSYSNSGYVLLAIIVERVAGKPMAQFAQERILRPLGMTSSHFNDDHAKVIPNRAQAYSRQDDGNYRLDMMPLDDLVGDGALFTSVTDFARWNGNFASGIVGGAELLEMMQTPCVFNDGTVIDYAWGLGVDTFHSFHRVGHSGAWGGYRSNYFRLPELQFGVAVFVNLPDYEPRALTDTITEIVLADAFASGDQSSENADPSQSPDLSRVVMTEPEHLPGIYLQGDGEHILVVAYRDDLPVVDFSWGSLTLHRQDDGRYTQKRGHFTIMPIATADDGTVMTMQVHLVYDNEVIALTRINPPAAVTGADYAGRYYSDELDAFWEITWEHDALHLTFPKQDAVTYQPIATDRFGGGGLYGGVDLRFQRDPDGNVTGFIYHSGYIGTLAFIRQR